MRIENQPEMLQKNKLNVRYATFIITENKKYLIVHFFIFIQANNWGALCESKFTWNSWKKWHFIVWSELWDSHFCEKQSTSEFSLFMFAELVFSERHIVRGRWHSLLKIHERYTEMLQKRFIHDKSARQTF